MKGSRGSIKWKLMLLYAVLVVIVIIVIGIYMIGKIRRNLYQSRYQEMQYTAGRISDTVELAYGAGKQDLTEVFTKVVTGILTESGNREGLLLYLLSPQGEMLYSREGSLSPADLSSRTILGAVNGQESAELYVHEAVYDEETRIVGDYALPVFRGSEIWYILMLRQSLSDIQGTIRSNALIILMASLIAIAISSLLAYLLAVGIAHPLERLTRRTQEMARGNLDAAEEMTEKSGSSDEIEELETNFSYMAGELKRMLSEASSEKNKLETIFHHMADGLMVFDYDGKVAQCNPAATELIGKGIHGLSFGDIFPEESFEDFLHAPEGRIRQRTLELDGQSIRAEFAAYANEAGEAEGLIVVLQDVTEQHHVEEMQREFVANVSHELRTPITTVKSYVETILEGEIREEETLTGFLQVIDQESDRMTALIAELLELSRIDNRQVQLAMKRENLTEVLADCVRRYRIHADKKHQQLIMGADCPALPVRCDRARMEQVIGNILINAINYSADGAVITAWSTLNPEVHEGALHIQDTGMGIPYKEQRRIFERFYRIDKARSRSSGGTGLGLAIAKEMMEMHHGRIELDSVPGKGSTFHLILPLMDGEEAEDEEI